ncbi:NUDIX hydrolase [Clostridium tunisiense]|uniref:NUDIX hydrolase n=1 Tax=Clostridium tunisiense TaxID=219748 RepID=UPI0002F2597E|nr:NUDIX domain-containing protein [Clostridium tunisiense]
MEEENIVFKNPQGCFTYRVAAIIIKDNCLLMAKYEDYSCYYTVGGKVRMNETSEEAIIREVYEETGIEFQIDKLCFIQERFFQVKGQAHHEVTFYYLMKDTSDIDLSYRKFTDQGTKESLHWLSVESLAEANIIPEFFKTKLLMNIDSIEHIVSKE